MTAQQSPGFLSTFIQPRPHPESRDQILTSPPFLLQDPAWWSSTVSLTVDDVIDQRLRRASLFLISQSLINKLVIRLCGQARTWTVPVVGLPVQSSHRHSPGRPPVPPELLAAVGGATAQVRSRSADTVGTSCSDQLT